MAVLKVSNFMTQKVLTAHPDDGIRHTFFRMREDDVRHFHAGNLDPLRHPPAVGVRM